MHAIKISEIDNEARVLDFDLAVALQFDHQRSIRTLIDRNVLELETHGILLRRVAKSESRGRPSSEYLLNEPQALLICMFARTPRAAEARKMLIDVFMAWRAGKTVHVDEHYRRPPGRRVVNAYVDLPPFFKMEECFATGLMQISALASADAGYEMLLAFSARL